MNNYTGGLAHWMRRIDSTTVHVRFTPGVQKIDALRAAESIAAHYGYALDARAWEDAGHDYAVTFRMTTPYTHTGFEAGAL